MTLAGGSDPHVMIRNIMKKTITNNVAQQFSWAGKKTKRSFKNLKLANVIIRKFILYYIFYSNILLQLVLIKVQYF